MTRLSSLDHKPVLVKEVLAYLAPEKGKRYLDVTFGCGGHTRAILEQEPQCQVIALDMDKQSLEKYGLPLQDEFGDRLKILWGNFASLYSILKKERISNLDGILADFGTSQYQIHSKEGLSFYNDTPLDMRLSKSHHYITAQQVLNSFSQQELANLFFELGEERNAKKIAHAIVTHRDNNSLKTTRELAALVESVIPSYNSRLHPATKVFQALRIFVNKELENIRSFLPGAIHVLNPGAPLICISFHSLEDRIIKNYFQTHTEQLEIVTKKPIIAGEEEVSKNPSARSAKLRVARKAAIDTC